MKPVRTSLALQRLLGEVLQDIEPPSSGRDYDASLRRNREIQRRLMERATLLAEETWPGFCELMSALIEREGEFLLKARPEA